MKTGIHPEYQRARVTCACGRATETRSTMEKLHVEICSHCHPFFTGRQKLVDTAGRVERFMAKYGMGEEAEDMAKEVAEREAESERQDLPEEIAAANIEAERAAEAARAAREAEEGAEPETVVAEAAEAAEEGEEARAAAES